MRITRLFVLLALAALLAPRVEASRTSVWERNPHSSLTETKSDTASALASLAPAAVANVDGAELPRFDLGDIVLVERELELEQRFDLGPLTLVDLNLLRGPPPSYPETRVGGFELLPPFRVGASASLSLWSRQACGWISCELASDSRYDPWGLCTNWFCQQVFRFAHHDPTLTQQARQIQGAAAKADAAVRAVGQRTAKAAAVVSAATVAIGTAPVSAPLLLGGGALLATQSLGEQYDVRRAQQLVAGSGTRSEALGLAVSDKVGFTGIAEGLLEYRVVTGAGMSKGEAGEALGGGAFDASMLMTGAAASAPAVRQVGASSFHFSKDVYASVRLPMIARGSSADVDAAIASGSRDQLIELGAGAGEAMQALSGGRTAAAARGSIIDTVVKDRASTTFGLRGLHYAERFEYGPDISNPLTGRAWDVTTPGQWGRHVERYVTNPPPGRPSWTSLDPLFTK